MPEAGPTAIMRCTVVVQLAVVLLANMCAQVSTVCTWHRYRNLRAAFEYTAPILTHSSVNPFLSFSQVPWCEAETVGEVCSGDQGHQQECAPVARHL